MAALDFPTNPTDQQQYTLNGIVYYYNASVGAWLTVLTSKLSDTSSNTQVMFNDAGVSNGSPGLVFNKIANTLTANTIVTTGSISVNGTSTLTGTPFRKNLPSITSDYTISTTYNEMSIGPITVADGVTVNIAGEWVIV